MARVLKGSHNFTCTPRVHPQRNEPYLAFPAEAGTHVLVLNLVTAHFLTQITRNPIAAFSENRILENTRIFSRRYSRFTREREKPEMRGNDVTGEYDAAFDEAGAADTGAGGQLYVDRWTAR